MGSRCSRPSILERVEEAGIIVAVGTDTRRGGAFIQRGCEGARILYTF